MQTLLLSITGAFLVIALVLWLFEQERKKNRFSPFTEKMLRSPGYSLNKQLEEKGDNLLIPFMTVALTPFIFVHFLKDVNFETRLFTGLVFLLPIIWAINRIRKDFKEIRKLRLGFEGEVYTGQELNYLMRQGAWVYHDIPYKYGNIDHIIVSKAGIFTVETKAVRKPMNDTGGKEFKVSVNNGSLVFPHFTTSKPIKQVQMHTKHLKEFLFRKTGYNYPVYSMVALPGWCIDIGNNKNGFLVFNPKRKDFIERYLQDQKISDNDVKRAAIEIEEFARTVSTNTDITDPDANRRYSFFLNRKHQEPKL